jgi:DNA-binding transcriptional ArsR family regulator
MTRASPFYLRDIGQIRAVASPVRAAVVDALEVIAPATVVQLGSVLGYPPDGLYYHLRVLERRGLVVRSGSEKATGAATFDLPGRPATLSYRLEDGQQRQAMAKVVATMMRSAERSFRRAFAPGRAQVNGPQRNLRAGRRTAWLTAGELRALNRHVEAIHELFARGRPQRAGARLHEFTYVVAPVIQNGRRGQQNGRRGQQNARRSQQNGRRGRQNIRRDRAARAQGTRS